MHIHTGAMTQRTSVRRQGAVGLWLIHCATSDCLRAHLTLVAHMCYLRAHLDLVKSPLHFSGPHTVTI